MDNCGLGERFLYPSFDFWTFVSSILKPEVRVGLCAWRENKLGDFKRRHQSELYILVTRNRDGLSAMETVMGMITIFGKQETIPYSSTSLIVLGEHLNKTKHEAGRTTVVYLGSTEHLETFTLTNRHSWHQSHLEGFGTGSTDPQEDKTRCRSSVGAPVTIRVS